MGIEQTPSVDDLLDSLEAKEEIRGIGFGKLADSLAGMPGVLRTLEEQKPLYLVTDCTGQPADIEELLRSLLVERLSLNPDESQLINAFQLANFSDEEIQRIISDGRRPVILPIAVGHGESPAWRVGPHWSFTSDGNVAVFRRQLQDLQR